MNELEILLEIIESVLGKSKPTTDFNHKFYCPFCNHHHPKLEVNTTLNENYNVWRCWVCGSSGLGIKNLFKKLQVSSDKRNKLELINFTSLSFDVSKVQKKVLDYPDSFISVLEPGVLNSYTNVIHQKAINYLYSRGINENHWFKYNIGFCYEGRFKNKIVIPSFDSKNQLNFYVGRKFIEDGSTSHDRPSIPVKQIIGLENTINWKCPIILVEGIFDAITIQRNTIPLFGKYISEALMKRILLSDTDKIYIALDNDASSLALEHCQTLMSYGKEVYLVEMTDKDANSMGFEKFLDLISHTEPLSLKKITQLKLDYYGKTNNQFIDFTLL